MGCGKVHRMTSSTLNKIRREIAIFALVMIASYIGASIAAIVLIGAI